MPLDNTMKNKLSAGVHVKIEPGTSAASESFTMENLPRIKSEPNLPPVSTQRLTSFRVPRDLTLGGNIKTEKSKKVYTPNINVRRNKKGFSEPSPLPSPKVKHELVKQTNDGGRGRGRSNRGRGERGRGKANIIQSAGIWSEGIHIPTNRRRYSTTSDKDHKDTGKLMEKSKISPNKVIEKEELEEKMKKLLDDDVTDEDEQIDDRLEPLVLPRVKQNAPSSKSKVENAQRQKPGKSKTRTIADIAENKSNSYVLMQFPDHLPGVEPTKEQMEQAGATGRCSLSTLNNGFLGKLEILKSGKTRIRLGDTYFHVDLGVQGTSRQDLMAVKLDAPSSTGKIINLGAVDGKLICSPDLDQILRNFKI